MTTRCRALLAALIVVGGLTVGAAACQPYAACVTSTSPGPHDQAELAVGGGYVDMGMWNTNAGSTQTLCASGPGDWTVDARMVPSDGLAVQSYPANKFTFANVAVSGLRSLTSSYSTVAPPLTTGVWEGAYDVWFASGVTTNTTGEVMVWTTTSNERAATNGARVVARGVLIGGDSYTYQLYGGWLPQIVRTTSRASDAGTVDLLGVFRYLESVGVLRTSATLREVQFGVEWCNTADATEAFTVAAFSLAAT